MTEIYPPDKCDEPHVVLDGSQLFKKIEDNPELLITQVQLVSPPNLKASAPDFDIHDPAPSVDHIFLLDDNVRFLNAVADVLQSSGYQVTTATSEEEALKKLQSLKRVSIHVALIDPHLLDDMIAHDGLKVARRIAQTHPYCKIVLVSGEEIGPEHATKVRSKINDCKDVKVAAYLQKPLTVAQLHEEIALAAARQTQELEELLAPLIKEPCTSPAQGHALRQDVKDIDKRWSVDEAVNYLGERLQGVVVHIFEMHPLKKQGRSIAHYGEELRWEVVRHKLAKSPVRDTAIDPKRAPWMNHDVDATAHLQGKHFWLRQVMDYRSALGIPIWTRSPMGYCLLTFHPKPHKFTPEFVMEARLCAERVERALEWQWLMTQSDERSRFETAGMAFACLGHELKSDLTALSADVLTLEKWIQETAQGGTLPPAASDKVADLRSGIDRSIAVSQTFRGVQSRGTAQLLNVFECLDDAIRAAKTQVPPGKGIEVRRVEYGAQKYMVRADRPGLVLALFNLLLNAVQQITLFVRPKGLVWVEWKPSNDSTGDWIRIDINDTGPGIHSADFERVFDIGYSTKPEGTGMGLHICQQVIAGVRDGQRTGKVEVSKSVLCIGTTFSVHLPVVDSGCQRDKGGISR